MPNQCSECAYFHLRGDPEAEGGTFGECRRYAPRATLFHHAPEAPLADTHIETFWPTVLDVDWCGEFERP